MRLTYQQAWQHKAVREREGEKDITEKFKVIDILRREFNLYGLTGEILMIDSESCRMPDIMVKGVIPICIEMDGEWHGMGDDVSKKDKDVNRDSDYNSIGVKLVIINKEVTEGYDTDKVIKCLEESGLRRK